MVLCVCVALCLPQTFPMGIFGLCQLGLEEPGDRRDRPIACLERGLLDRLMFLLAFATWAGEAVTCTA